MMIDEFPSHEIFTGLDFEFKAIRVMDGHLTPIVVKLHTELMHLDFEVQATSAVGDTYTKILYFIKEVLENSVIIERTCEWSASLFIDIDTGLPTCVNNLIHIPEIANNINLAKVLQCKLNSLASDGVDISFIKLSSCDAPGLVITSVGNSAEDLPTMEEWVGPKSHFSKPWWMRDDASTMDVAAISDEDIAEAPAFAYTLNFLLSEPEEDETGPPKVVRGEFRPRVITGGKTD